MTMLDRLTRLEREIRIAIIGVGAMGKGLLYQSTVTPGIRCVAIADVRLDAAIAVAKETGLPWRVVDTLAGLHDAITGGAIGVTADGDLLARCELADALVEASSSITPAARFAITAIEHGKHLVLMNSEIDLVFGSWLLELARKHGVTYTSCDGDQHGVIRHLVDELRLWGFELVMGGNIKGFLDRYTDPVRIIPEAEKRNLDPRMATAYTDGTKLSIEMALLANAFDLRTLVPGMQGQRAKHVSDVFDLFDFEAIRETGSAVVDYILGAEPDGGVFAVGYCANAYQRSMLSYYKMGRGPFYLFYRPYHLCHVEAMAGIAAACLDGESLLAPDHGMRTNVIAYAKRDLRAGETLDGLGGFTAYGQIENMAGAATGLPICLADDVTLERDVPRDGRIALADVHYDARRFDFELYFKALAATERR